MKQINTMLQQNADFVKVAAVSNCVCR